MKKLLPFILAVIMMISLSACGGGDGTQRGKVKNNVYTHETFGITFTAPQGYEFYNDRQIAATYGTTTDILYSSDAIIYDMQCGNTATNGSVSVVIEDTAAVYGMALDTESYLTLNLASVRTSYDGLDGVQIKETEKYTAKISDMEFDGVYITLDVNGAAFYEIIFVAEHEGQMMRVTAAAYDEAELNELIDAIQIA